MPSTEKRLRPWTRRTFTFLHAIWILVLIVASLAVIGAAFFSPAPLFWQVWLVGTLFLLVYPSVGRHVIAIYQIHGFDYASYAFIDRLPFVDLVENDGHIEESELGEYFIICFLWPLVVLILSLIGLICWLEKRGPSLYETN